MFGKEKQNKAIEATFINQLMEDEDIESEETEEPDTEITVNAVANNQAGIVIMIEKISEILSPYFIVIVGFSLYDKNFFLSTLLLFTGIIYLLKINKKDLDNFINIFKRS